MSDIPMSAIPENVEHVPPPPRAPHVQHQFDDAEQQRQTATLGMWTFLATEILFFGAIFAAYTVFRFLYQDQFIEGSKELLEWIGALNTGVLLTSSFTVVLALHFIKTDNRKLTLLFLCITIFLGFAFLGLKGLEYWTDYKLATVPTTYAFIQKGYAPPEQLFFSFYFIMTGIHALHMIIGIGLFTVITILTWRGHYSAEYHNPIEISALYWHFVDIVWIFLFPLLYLIR